MEDTTTYPKVYMCVECDENCTWRVLDTDTHELLKVESDQMNSSTVKTPLKHGSAVLGTKIYVIGGSSPCQENVQIFDTATQTWALGANMDVEMHYPLVVPVPSMNMLFVFGGMEETFCARAYDIKLNEWETIENPKKPITKNLTGYFFFGGILVMWNEDLFCTFHVETKTWKDQIKVKPYFPEKKFCGIVPRALLLRKCLLFWFSGTELMSYNLSADETLKAFLLPKDAKDISQYFQSVTSSFLVPCSDEKLCLIWVNNEPEGTKRWHWCTFKLSHLPDDDDPGDGPLRLQLDNSPVADFLPGDAQLHHVLTMKQPTQGLSSSLSCPYTIYKGRCVRVLLKDLSRRMYIKNYLSFSRNMECKGDLVAKPVEGYCPEVEISIDSLMRGLRLNERCRDIEKCRNILDRIIDKDVLQLLTEDEIKKLNISVSRASARSTEEPAEGDSDTEEEAIDKPIEEAGPSLRISTDWAIVTDLKDHVMETLNPEPQQDFGNEVHEHMSSRKRLKR